MPTDVMHLPAAYAQQRIMLIEHLAPGTAAYNVPFALRMCGPLDTDALRSALHDLVARHEALRTAIDLVDGGFVQVIRSELDVPLHVEDLEGTPEATNVDALNAFLRRRAARPLALDECLLRLELYRVGDREHVLAVTMHHLVSDYWSCGVFIRDLSALYDQRRAQQPALLPELEVQYADYALWQRDALTDERVTELTEFWRRTLDEAPEILHVPSDRPRPATQTFRGGTESVELSPEVSAAVLALGKELGATPFMVMLAAFQVVLGRWADRDDIVVSTGVATRTAQVDDLIGSFINIVLIRSSLAANPTFAELVQRVRTNSLAAFDHQDLPFDKLVADLAPSRDLSYQPLTQVMFVVQNAPMPTPRMRDLEVSAWPVDRDATQTDLDLQLWLDGDHFEGFVEYSRDMYEPATIRRLFDQFSTLLSAAVDDPRTPVDALPVHTEAEESRIVSEWNATEAVRPHQGIHELIVEWAEADSSAVALVHDGVELTYGELTRRAGRLAGHLRTVGAGPDVLAAVYLDHSIDRIVAILGVLMAGSAYLPLDPGYPAERLAFMVSDARPPLLVTRSDLSADISSALEDAEVRTVHLDELTGTTDHPPVVFHPENLAYVIYTSGSTGRPKGIAVQHDGVTNNIADLNRMAEVAPGDRVLALSSVSFDMSVYETLGVLTAGATVVLPSAETAGDPRHWLDLAIEHRVTLWNSAPALLEALATVAETTGTVLPSLKAAFLGGDWVSLSLPDRMRAIAPNMAFVSLGGATEASIHSIVHKVERVLPDWASIPYGRPQDNQQAVILDSVGRVVPVGVPGELHLAGAGLSRGYLGRAGQTAERFLPHPYAGSYPNIPLGARVYRTGDLAKYGPDGVIELLGRLDHQVKIRGFRIEPGEIESALVAQPGVEEAVVTASSTGDRVLAAFVVGERNVELDTNELRSRLRASLPSYLVPASITLTDRIPLTPNGKVDRARLAALGVTREHDPVVSEQPRTPLQQAVAAMWSSVLEAEEIGLDEDFFRLGGHSLNAVELVTLFEATFGLEVPLRTVFDAPTVRDQASWLVESAGDGMDLDAVAATALRLNDLSDAEVERLLAEEAG